MVSLLSNVERKHALRWASLPNCQTAANCTGCAARVALVLFCKDLNYRGPRHRSKVPLGLGLHRGWHPALQPSFPFGLVIEAPVPRSVLGLASLPRFLVHSRCFEEPSVTRFQAITETPRAVHSVVHQKPQYCNLNLRLLIVAACEDRGCP